MWVSEEVSSAWSKAADPWAQSKEKQRGVQHRDQREGLGEQEMQRWRVGDTGPPYTGPQTRGEGVGFSPLFSFTKAIPKALCLTPLFPHSTILKLLTVIIKEEDA